MNPNNKLWTFGRWWTWGFSASNACGSASDTVSVTFLPHPDGFLPADSVHCLDMGFYLLNKQTPGP